MTKKKYEMQDEWHDRAEQFSKDFAKANYEMGQAQNFIRGLCEIYDAYSVAGVLFEDRIKKLGDDGGINRIDGFLPGLMLIEMKSEGKNLEAAREQAFGYIELLIQNNRQDQDPQYVLISDFKHLHLYDRKVSETVPVTIDLADLRNHVDKFAFLQEYEHIVEQLQEAVNIQAAEKLAALNEAIKITGYGGKDLETLLVRILFCLFAEDSGLFIERNGFANLINNSRTDGRDLSGTLDMLFLALDAKTRPTSLYADYCAFPYVNGNLFSGRLSPCFFTPESRTALLACADEIDWSQISPSIFGSLFQAIMHFDDNDTALKSKKRREFGAHYTSERNILKTIKPLFLDNLKKELKDCKGDAGKLDTFIRKLSQIRLFDPACGCGNFLVVAYREIRLLETKALNQLANPKTGHPSFQFPVCNVNQCFGIEIDPSAVEIATVALWLVDHQMNMLFKSIDGKPYIRLPLTAKANIVCGNALQLDWNSVIPPKDCSYVMGNPPFIGKKEQNATQKTDMSLVFKDIGGSGVLDYVAAWYITAANFIKENTAITAAFVSTNSITQGEQVGVLWKWMLDEGIKIHFAHRTFRWSNEGKGVAAVHCVIIGFGLNEPKQRVIFDYSDISGDPTLCKVKNINPYLVDAPSVVADRRMRPLCPVPEIVFGSKAVDFGHLVINHDELDSFVATEPAAKQYIREFIGGEEFLNGGKRYCLWLKGVEQQVLHSMPLVMKRVNAVMEERLKSVKVPTRALASKPAEFGEDRQPVTPYLLIPKVSSETRIYVPLGFLTPDIIINPTVLVVPNASVYDFGVLQSVMHMVWMRAVCGRMKSDYQYSATIVYNNFPWPEKSTQELNDDVEVKAQKILDVRKAHINKTLADLYNPETMPKDLADAHNDLDDAVDACYGYTGKKDDATRVAFLFKLYGVLVKGN